MNLSSTEMAVCLKLKVYAVSGMDTIHCKINKDNISIPKLTNVGSILINFKNDTYQLNIDFSKLSDKESFFIGLDNNMNNFTQPLPKQPLFYMHKDLPVILKLKNYQAIKNIYFLNFSYIKSVKGDKASTSNYTSYTTH